MSFEHLILSWLTLQTDTEIHLRDKKYSTVLFAYFRLPSWTENVFYPGSEMEKLAAYSFSMQTNKKLQARLKAGFLIREMLQHFTMKANSTLTPDRSMWIYSAHDKTVANLLNALGLFEVCIFYFLLYIKSWNCKSNLALIAASAHSSLCFVRFCGASQIQRWILHWDFLQKKSWRRCRAAGATLYSELRPKVYTE